MHGRGTRVRVLIAEDEPVARRLLDSMVQQWGYESVVCTDGAQAWEALQHASAPRLAVVDWMMPECSGPELCRKLRRQEREAYVYIILLTSRGNTNDVVAGLDAGADDYLRKPFDRHELRVRLRAGRRIIELQDELIATQSALRDQATHDSLTGLWNRRAILEMLQAEMARAERQEEPLSVLIADIDRFKAVNDTRGHMVGDVVLRDRRHLSRDGFVVVVAARDEVTGELLEGPDIISRGFVFMRDAEELMEEAKELVIGALAAGHRDTVNTLVRDRLAEFLYERTRRRPMVFPVILDV